MNRNDLTGLCATCNHAETCVFLSNASASIWCCEEFDDRPIPLMETAEAAKDIQPAHDGVPQYAKNT